MRLAAIGHIHRGCLSACGHPDAGRESHTLQLVLDASLDSRCAWMAVIRSVKAASEESPLIPAGRPTWRAAVTAWVL